MLGPALTAGMEEPFTTSRIRVDSFRLIGLVDVAQATGEPKGLFVVGSALRTRDDVFDLEPGENEPLRGESVSATVAHLRTDALPDGAR